MRRFVIATGAVGTAALAAVLLLPWWLGAVLPLIGGPLGLGFNGYTRVGYGRFALESFELRRAEVFVRAEKIEAETPVLWLWHRWTGRPSAVVAGPWRVEVESNQGKANSNSSRGWVPLKQLLAVVSNRLAFWLPRANVGSGVVTWPGSELTFGSATWEARTLNEESVGYRGLAVAATLAVPANGEMRLTLRALDNSGGTVLQTEGASVVGRLTWWQQPADLVAHFGDTGWQPQDARLQAEHWEIAAEHAKWGAHYAMLRGGGKIEWREGQLRADAAIDGVPRKDDEAPPLALKLHGRGGVGELFVDALELNLPGVSARLSEPVAIGGDGRLRSGSSRFTFDADLAQLPWIAMRGRLRGDGQIAPSANGVAVFDFSLSGENLVVAGTEATRVDVTGKLEWPKLVIAQAKMATAEGNELNGRGEWDFQTQAAKDAVVRGKIGPSLLARWVPENLKFQTLDVEASGSGPWRELSHEGRVRVDRFQVDGMKALDGEVSWRGRGAAIDTLAASAQAGKTKIAATGSADAAHLSVVELTLTRTDGAQLRLAQPFGIRWRPAVEIEGLHFVGAQTALDATLRWAESGQIDLSARHLASDWLQDFLILPPVAWTAESFSLRGEWDRGPVVFSTEAVVTVDLGNNRAAQISARAQGGADGIRLESLQMAEGEGMIVKASGRFPILLHPRQGPLVEILNDAPFALDAASSPNPEFWKKFAQLIGFDLAKPEVTAHLTGTLAQPRGEANFHADGVVAIPGRFTWNWPKIEMLDLRLTGDKDGVKLDRFSVAVEGQAVRAQGWLPVSSNHWRDWFTDPVGLVRQGDLRVEIPDADLAAIAQYFPAYLAPKGRLQLDLSVKANSAISGFLRVRDATSRPLGPLGVLQEVNADLRFDGRAVNLQAVTAKMGGQVVTLKGRAELPPEGEPQLDLTLTGENLPFVRQTGLLLRGDLDLKLTSAANGQTAITGIVRLRDSLFLTDIRSLIPSGAKGSAARPPYFSIEYAPLNRWRIDVKVEGEKFLRLRTPVFNGTASARFQLSGTLGEPQAVGEVRVDEGNIRLPFANFQVQEGQARLTPDQTEPQLFLTGTTRRYGYDLRMELTGPASAPVLTFSSSPPLAAEQVLLMVMAGQAPREEIATTDRQRAARFGAFFGQSLLGAIGGDAEGADRLTISSGENISAQGRETYSIEYRLGERWALTGEYDEFDEYYGGVKWRFYEKGGKHAAAKK